MGGKKQPLLSPRISDPLAPLSHPQSTLSIDVHRKRHGHQKLEHFPKQVKS